MAIIVIWRTLCNNAPSLFQTPFLSRTILSVSISLFVMRCVRARSPIESRSHSLIRASSFTVKITGLCFWRFSRKYAGSSCFCAHDVASGHPSDSGLLPVPRRLRGPREVRDRNPGVHLRTENHAARQGLSSPRESRDPGGECTPLISLRRRDAIVFMETAVSWAN